MLNFGAALAAIVRPGDAIGLSGDLGVGKTTLARGLLRGLGLVGEAPSPSFAIVQPYAPPETRLPVLHVDLYRLDDGADTVELGLDDARQDHLLLIEWPERMGAFAWADMLMLNLRTQSEEMRDGAGQEAGDSAGDSARVLTANVPPAWETRWLFR